MKKVVLGAMVLLWMAPAMLQAGWGWDNKNKEENKEQRVEQKQEDPQLRPTLKEKTPEEKQAAIQERRETQAAENKVSQQGMLDKQMGELKVKLAKNTKLTEAQKSEILARRQRSYVFTKQHPRDKQVHLPTCGR